MRKKEYVKNANKDYEYKGKFKRVKKTKFIADMLS